MFNHLAYILWHKIKERSCEKGWHVAFHNAKMSDCPKRWVGAMCVSLPVADLGPPQTGHGLFQVLPQVRNVLHCPHASRLGILSCQTRDLNDLPEILGTCMHTRTAAQCTMRRNGHFDFLWDVLVSGCNDDQLSVTASRKKIKKILTHCWQMWSLMMTQPVGLNHAQLFWADM